MRTRFGPRFSRRRFLQSTALASGLLLTRGVFKQGRSSAKGLELIPPHTGARTVDHVFTSFFDAQMPHDIWEARTEVGYSSGVRRYTYPVLHEWADFAGPDLTPGMRGTNWLYAPGRWKADARALPGLTIDTIGGVRSPASGPNKRGFLPRDLMGGLEGDPVGGLARMQLHQGYVGRARAEELKYPYMFGYHGWEEETNATIVMNRVGAMKILGCTAAQYDNIDAWWAANRDEVERKWWYWLFDEGGDHHVGGTGRLDVRYAFDTPLQMWLSDLDLAYDPDADLVTLSWDWVSMAGSALVSRWISEALGIRTAWESNSLSDINVDLRIDDAGGDLLVDTGVDYMLYKTLKTNVWTFEPALTDVPNLAVEYLDESIYEPAEAAAYAGKEWKPGEPYNYTPSVWNLREGESITIDWSDLTAKGDLDVQLGYAEPGVSGGAQIMPNAVRYIGPLDIEAWSKTHYPTKWLALADENHPDGLTPWGEPYVTLRIIPSTLYRKAFANPAQPPRLPTKDPEWKVPTFVPAALAATPPLPEGRTVKVDLYSMRDVPMVPSRWNQYDTNKYMEVVSLEAPVQINASSYFPPDPQTIVPFDTVTSGIRVRCDARNLSELTINTIGGGDQGPYGFLPFDLMGNLSDGVEGGTAHLTSRMAYGSRAREARYRMPDFWGYYGWENYWDGELTLDAAAAQKVLGITAEQFNGFSSWFGANSDALRTAWRQWLYREFHRVQAMAWFNYPLQIWAFQLKLTRADPSGITLKFSILNEAQDVTIGRWFRESFLSGFEGSWDDLYLSATIGPESSNVFFDGVADWGVERTQAGEHPRWWWEPFYGDNPYLAQEYRMSDSPAMDYAGTDFSEVPVNWDLAEGEQVNFHLDGNTLISATPNPTQLPDSVDINADRVSYTGPMNLTAWSKEWFAGEWDEADGNVPFGLPAIEVEE